MISLKGTTTLADRADHDGVGCARWLFAEYSAAFRRYGVPDVCELRLSNQDQRDGERTLTGLAWATGVFFTGGDQSRLSPLAGSRANLLLRDRLAAGKLVVAGTSAGATVLTHDLLMAGGGLYADLYTLQASAYDAVRPA